MVWGVGQSLLFLRSVERDLQLKQKQARPADEVHLHGSPLRKHNQQGLRVAILSLQVLGRGPQVGRGAGQTQIRTKTTKHQPPRTRTQNVKAYAKRNNYDYIEGSQSGNVDPPS